MQDETSLREKKRLETRHRIEDAATLLVDQRGFASVTVEEICEAAGISRRTFFNYFDSKDSAVLGSPGENFTEEQRERFLTTPASSMMELVVKLVKIHMAQHHADPEISARRVRISTDADAAAATLSRKRAKSNELKELIMKRLELHPELRLTPHLTLGIEAILIASTVREAVWLASASEDLDCQAPFEQRFEEALHLITDFSKGLTW